MFSSSEHPGSGWVLGAGVSGVLSAPEGAHPWVKGLLSAALLGARSLAGARVVSTLASFRHAALGFSGPPEHCGHPGFLDPRLAAPQV